MEKQGSHACTIALIALGVVDGCCCIISPRPFEGHSHALLAKIPYTFELHTHSVALARYRHNWLISGNHRGNQEVRPEKPGRVEGSGILENAFPPYMLYRRKDSNVFFKGPLDQSQFVSSYVTSKLLRRDSLSVLDPVDL